MHRRWYIFGGRPVENIKTAKAAVLDISARGAGRVAACTATSKAGEVGDHEGQEMAVSGERPEAAVSIQNGRLPPTVWGAAGEYRRGQQRAGKSALVAGHGRRLSSTAGALGEHDLEVPPTRFLVWCRTDAVRPGEGSGQRASVLLAPVSREPQGFGVFHHYRPPRPVLVGRWWCAPPAAGRCPGGPPFERLFVFFDHRSMTVTPGFRPAGRMVATSLAARPSRPPAFAQAARGSDVAAGWCWPGERVPQRTAVAPVGLGYRFSQPKNRFLLNRISSCASTRRQVVQRRSCRCQVGR